MNTAEQETPYIRAAFSRIGVEGNVWKQRIGGAGVRLT